MAGSNNRIKSKEVQRQNANMDPTALAGQKDDYLASSEVDGDDVAKAGAFAVEGKNSNSASGIDGDRNNNTRGGRRTTALKKMDVPSPTVRSFQKNYEKLTKGDGIIMPPTHGSTTWIPRSRQVYHAAKNQGPTAKAKAGIASTLATTATGQLAAKIRQERRERLGKSSSTNHEGDDDKPIVQQIREEMRATTEEAVQGGDLEEGRDNTIQNFDADEDPSATTTRRSQMESHSTNYGVDGDPAPAARSGTTTTTTTAFQPPQGAAEDPTTTTNSDSNNDDAVAFLAVATLVVEDDDDETKEQQQSSCCPQQLQERTILKLGALFGSYLVLAVVIIVLANQFVGNNKQKATDAAPDPAPTLPPDSSSSSSSNTPAGTGMIVSLESRLLSSYDPNTTTKIKLDNGAVKGSIPTQIGLYTNLKELELDSNDLTGTIPSQLGLCTLLEELDLEENLLFGKIPTQLGLLTRLEKTNLEGNRLTGTIPLEVCTLVGLEKLHIDCSGEQPSPALQHNCSDCNCYNPIDGSWIMIGDSDEPTCPSCRCGPKMK